MFGNMVPENKQCGNTWWMEIYVWQLLSTLIHICLFNLKWIIKTILRRSPLITLQFSVNALSSASTTFFSHRACESSYYIHDDSEPLQLVNSQQSVFDNPAQLIISYITFVNQNILVTPSFKSFVMTSDAPTWYVCGTLGSSSCGKMHSLASKQNKQCFFQIKLWTLENLTTQLFWFNVWRVIRLTLQWSEIRRRSISRHTVFCGIWLLWGFYQYIQVQVFHVVHDAHIYHWIQWSSEFWSSWSVVLHYQHSFWMCQ